MFVAILTEKKYGLFPRRYNLGQCNSFHSQVFTGNKDQNSTVKRSLSTDVAARFVRFYPVTYYHWPCLRVEIYVLKSRI